MGAHTAGEIESWPTKQQLVVILQDAGLQVVVGPCSVRVLDCSHFIFQQLGGDLGDPVVDAEAETVENMVRDAGLVSNALARADVKHRFEIYDDRNDLSGYLHYDWPHH